MPHSHTSGWQRDRLGRQVHACLRGLVVPGQRVLVGISGGADSVALAVAITEIAPGLGIGLCLGMVDHGLRRGSADEVARVSAWAREREIEFASVRVRVKKEGGLEAAARKVRYAALERLAEKLGADWMATAHTASDQAETVLLGLGRGAGARGGRGVLPVRGRVLRPLLGVTRADVERFLASRGERALVADPSNADLARARNRIRHRVLPELREALGPGVDRALARFATLARDDETALQEWADRTDSERAALRALPVAVLRRWIRSRCEALDYRPTAVELDSVARVVRASRGREIELGRRLRVRVGARVEIIAQRGVRSGPSPASLAAGSRVAWNRHQLELREMARAKATGPLELALPGDVALPLSVRGALPGDALRGEHGTIRVNRLLMDKKIPRGERAEVPVLLDAHGELLWVIGHRVSASVRAGQGATPGWQVRVKIADSGQAKRRPVR